MSENADRIDAWIEGRGEPGNCDREIVAFLRGVSAELRGDTGLRDRFAMAALTGFCAGSAGEYFGSQGLAERAYEQADAMLVARARKEVSK